MKIKGSPTPKKIVNKCVGAKVQDKKTGWIFNIQNSQLLTLSLPTEEIFQVHSQKRPVENLPVVDFRSQPREIQLPKPLNTKLSVFLFLFWFSFPSKKVWTAPSVSDTNFFSVLEALIRENSNKQPRIESSEGFAVNSSTWPSGAKGKWRVSSWLTISNTPEKISYFFTCVVTTFLRARNPCTTP